MSSSTLGGEGARPAADIAAILHLTRERQSRSLILTAESPANATRRLFEALAA